MDIVMRNEYQSIDNVFIGKRVAWGGIEWSRTVWRKMICHGMVQNRTEWSGMVWCYKML